MDRTVRCFCGGDAHFLYPQEGIFESGRVCDERHLSLQRKQQNPEQYGRESSGKEGRCKQRLIDFVAVMGTLGSICAILIPTNGTDFTTALAYQCFVYHGGLLWFSLYLILSGRAKLGLKAMGSNIGMLLLLAVAVLYVNGALSAYGTNFMYLVRPPMEDLPYLNLEQGWYVYFLRLLLLGLGLVSLFHIPFILHQKNTGSRNTAC